METQGTCKRFCMLEYAGCIINFIFQRKNVQLRIETDGVAMLYKVDNKEMSFHNLTIIQNYG